MNSFAHASFDSFDRTTRPRGTEVVHALFLSLNVAFAISTFILYDVSAQALGPLVRVDSFLNKLLFIKQTDLLNLYWLFFLTGTVLALVFFAVLRLLSRTSAVHELLRSAAGFLAIGVAPCWYIIAVYKGDRYYGHSWGLFQHARNYELAVALACVFLYLKNWWPIPSLGSAFLLLGHYAFWFWEFRFSFRELVRGWGGSEAVLAVLGLAAGLTWSLYVSARQTSHLQPEKHE